MSFRDALDELAELRARHREYVEGYYLLAEEACNGAFLNQQGQDKGIDPWDLFRRNTRFFQAYASRELRDWVEDHPRLTFDQFESQVTERVGYYPN